MSEKNQPVVLVADEIGHVIAALKAPGEMTARFCRLEFFDSLRLAARSREGVAPVVAIVAQRKLPNGTGLEAAGDLWRDDSRLLIVLVTDTDTAIDVEDWRREFGASDRVQLLPWSGRTLELEQVIRSLLFRRELEDRSIRREGSGGALDEMAAVRGGFDDAAALSVSLAKELLDNAPDGIFFKDRESRYVRCSASFAQQVGLDSAAGVVNQSDFDFFSEEHALATFADEQEVIRTGTPITDKKERQTLPDGRTNWMLTSRVAWRNPAGEIVGIAGISKNITPLVELELEMQRYRDMLQAMLDHMPDRIYFKNTQSRFVLVSQAMAERLNVESSVQVVGKTDFDFHPPELARKFMQDEELIMASGKPLINKVEEQRDAHGETIYASVTKVPVYDGMGQVTGLIGISRDITDIKRAEETLKQTNEDLMRASRLAGMAEVATGVLHNIGNVLNSINVSSNVVADLIRRSKSANLERVCGLLEQHVDNLGQFLTEDEKGKQIPTFLQKLALVLRQEQETLLTELKEMHTGIDHIRDIITTQQGYAKVGGTVEPVEPSELIEQALRMEGTSLKRHDVEIERDIRPTPRIFVEKHKLLQVLVNLIRNAKQAMLVSRSKKLLLSVDQESGDHITISVTDSGKGISEENLAKLFTHGFTTKKDGHGFGLHSCALAVEEMGGKISARSEGAGKGATFVVELPTQRKEKVEN